MMLAMSLSTPQRESHVHHNILAHMSDGVVSVDGNGRIMTFNPAASRLLGIAADAALGRTLAEMFLSEDGLDELSQAIIDTVQGVNAEAKRLVEVRTADAVRLFTVTTSYLRELPTGGGAANLGVIAVFADVTQVKALQESERRLAKELEAQHAELRGAYRDLEDSNQTLAAALKKVQVARVVATVFVIGLFVFIGATSWNSPLAPASAATPSVGVAAADAETITVAPERLVSTISVFGSLVPRAEVLVTSPASGKVAEAHFQYGEHVAAGQQLLRLDTTEIEREHREALAAQIKAARNLAELEDWANNTEMARIRRDLSKARLALDNQKDNLDRTDLLLQQGIVSAAEHESAERQYQSQLLDYSMLERDMQTIRAKGDAQAQKVARLELESARVRVQYLEETLAKATVVAPLAGVLLKPSQLDGGRGERLPIKGQVVSQGERLFTIGDVDGLSVSGWLDEVDVDKIGLSQRVLVRGDAFPDLEFEGIIAHVSRQARQDSAREAPTFAFVALLDGIAAAERARLRLGMSVTVEIVVSDESEALLVPISAVQSSDDETWLLVRDPSGGIERRRVETGATTLTNVEILSGLSAGDDVLLTAVDAE